MTMARYYGTAIPQPPGFGLPALMTSPTLAEPKVLLSTLAWCDEAGCPAAKCVHCKETSK